MNIQELERQIEQQKKIVDEAYSTWPYEWYIQETNKLESLQRDLKALQGQAKREEKTHD